MSHFHGKTWGRVQSIATRCGDKDTGLITQALSDNGGVQVVLWHNFATNQDSFQVSQVLSLSGYGLRANLTSGVLGQRGVLQDDILMRDAVALMTRCLSYGDTRSDREIRAFLVRPEVMPYRAALKED